jgi:hypothetical protein
MASIRRYEKISKDLGRHREIPLRYHKDLEDRLAIAFEPQTPHIRQARGSRQPLGGTSPSCETRRRHKRKKARIVYQYVSENAPHTFLPFILSTSPNTCESFDPYYFCQSRKAEREVLLDDSVVGLFTSIAKRHGFAQNPEYQNLVTKILPNLSPEGLCNVYLHPLQLKAVESRLPSPPRTPNHINLYVATHQCLIY